MEDYLLIMTFFNKKQQLILKHNFFHSKEELLISCLYLVTDKIVEYLHRFTEINAVSMEEYKQEVRKQWNVFFTYLLKNASETLVFHEYVNSAGIMELLKSIITK